MVAVGIALIAAYTYDSWDVIEESGPEDLLEYLWGCGYFEEAFPTVKYRPTPDNFRTGYDLPVEGEIRLVLGYYEASETYSQEYGWEYDSWFTIAAEARVFDPQKQKQEFERLAVEVATHGICSTCHRHLVNISRYAKARRLCWLCAQREIRGTIEFELEQ